MGRSPSLRGLMAGAVLSCSATVGSTTAWPRPPRAQKKEGPAPWLPLLFPGLHQCRPCLSAGFSQPAFSPSWGQGCEGSCPPPTAPRSLHIHKFLVQPSKSRPQNGPREVCGQPPPHKGQHCHHGVDACRYCPRGLQKNESCNLLLLLLPQQPLHLLC